MLAWLIVQKTKACENQCEEALFNLIVAFIYIFTFFNVRDEPTRYKYLTFYTICFLENTLLLFTWFFSFNLSTPDILWFRISGLVGDYALFFLGILCMVLYYLYFHPSSPHLGTRTQQEGHKKGSSTASISFPSDPPLRTKSLARKGSIDASQIVGQSGATSSRRNLPHGNGAADHSIPQTATSKKLVSSSIPKVGQEDNFQSNNHAHPVISTDQLQPKPLARSDETRLWLRLILSAV